jgi:hypothetical protein
MSAATTWARRPRASAMTEAQPCAAAVTRQRFPVRLVTVNSSLTVSYPTDFLRLNRHW